ncbi:hypothetical protein [Terriglobus saanensis]|uniref:Uncharacterized protein n=1 Tax=Terriglobus saanensis (strain ATCC BAA-1853 / DSM 23119 / SP1PR4) TaxID=401053 RepID=E8V2U7_TERSS|nr:hypothetical protein [Terriglobus saanensis]ADV84644.1 hypothetical protein AciPR4_3895 [Terriglobus saanensis SP1PR4]
MRFGGMACAAILLGSFGISGAFAQMPAGPVPDQFLTVPAQGVKTLRLPGTLIKKAHWKGSFQAQGGGGARVAFSVANEKGVLWQVENVATAEFDVPIGKDGLMLTVRDDYPSGRRVVVKSRVEAGK